MTVESEMSLDTVVLINATVYIRISGVLPPPLFGIKWGPGVWICEKLSRLVCAARVGNHCLRQCLSIIKARMNHPEILLKCRFRFSGSKRGPDIFLTSSLVTPMLLVHRPPFGYQELWDRENHLISFTWLSSRHWPG